MISNKVVEALNSQINNEFYSAYLYLSMSAFFSEVGLFGFANWSGVQAKEEIDHGMIIFDFLLESGGKVELRQIAVPEQNFKTPVEAWNFAYNHEISLTSAIEDMASLFDDTDCRAARLLVDWFVKEQLEEESAMRAVASRMKIFGDDCTSLYLLDKELSKREYRRHCY